MHLELRYLYTGIGIPESIQIYNNFNAIKVYFITNFQIYIKCIFHSKVVFACSTIQTIQILNLLFVSALIQSLMDDTG